MAEGASKEQTIALGSLLSPEKDEQQQKYTTRTYIDHDRGLPCVKFAPTFELPALLTVRDLEDHQNVGY